MPATLRAIGFELVLRVEGYEFPQIDTGWDANALDHAFVHHAHTELEDLLGAYPVRGSLQID
jgi:hypothetical protein